jgi:hypothetical protein
MGARPRQLLVATLLAVIAVPLAASASTAQTCDPYYGCGTTTTGGSLPPSCSQAGGAVSGGEVRFATVDHVPAGATIRITFDGVTVGSGLASATGHANVAFTVPDEVGPGVHPVFAIGAAFSVACGTFGTTEAPQPADVAGNNAERGASSLPRTGIEIAFLVALAVVLVVGGQRLVAYELRRRRRVGRRHNAVVDRGERPVSR